MIQAVLFSFVLRAAEPVSLETFVREATGRSLAVNNAEREVRIAEAERGNARGFFLPRLDLTATAGKLETKPETLYQPDTSALGLSLSSVLYDPDSIARWSRTDVTVERARLALSQARDVAALEAAKRFLAYSRAVGQLEIGEATSRLLEQQYKVTTAQYRQGLKARRDFLRFEGQNLKRQLGLDQLRNAVDLSRISLRELWPEMGDDVRPYRPPASERIDLTVPALEAHREWRLARLAEKQRAYDYEIDKARLWPELGLKAAATYGAQDFTTPDPGATRSETRGWNVLLTATWNVFDWGYRRGLNEILSQRQAIAANEDERALRALRRTLSELNTRLPLVQRSAELSRELLKIEESSYRSLEVDYREGRVSYLDLISALDSLSSAREQELRDRVDRASLRYEVLSQQGGLYDVFVR